jgi:hypothetical protein
MLREGAFVRPEAPRPPLPPRQANIDSRDESEKHSKNALSDKCFHFTGKRMRTFIVVSRFDTKSCCNVEWESWRLRQITQWSRWTTRIS